VKKDDVGYIEELYLEIEYPQHIETVREIRVSESGNWMRVIYREAKPEIFL
jgi:NADH:ubiquinone oxidoreductase subunit D